MSNARRRKPPNTVGCKPTEDVCVAHDEPLMCKHGCSMADQHKCADITYHPCAVGEGCDCRGWHVRRVAP